MKLGILQFRPLLGRPDENRTIIRKFLVRRKFDLAVLPELSINGYNFKDRNELSEVAEDKRGRSFQLFEELSERCGGAIVWGMAEKCGNRIYNSAVLTTPEGDHRIYRKTHLFFREKLYFDSGNTGFRVFRWRGKKIGLMICFDWLFPEAARTLALKGAQIICHPANLVMSYCQDGMIIRSLENGIFCATANRVGKEAKGDLELKFTGCSQVTEPRGKRILGFSRTEQAFKTVKINPNLSDIKNVNRLNNLFTDRKIDYYVLKHGRHA
jgi:predicted amidohydrolase